MSAREKKRKSGKGAGSAKKTPDAGLDAIFRPRAVAVIGASRRKQTIGHEILHNIMEFEFTGPVYPVNPNADVVHSMRAYRKIGDIPDPVDLAVIVVPRDKVLPVIDQCAKKGVKGVVVITAGFKEVGGKGADLEAKIAQRLERHGMRMVGPNCMGVVNTEPAVSLNATFAAAVPTRGKIGLVSQSGALGEAILADAAGTGLGVAMFVSLGNKTDIRGNDMLEYWEHNDDVQVILMYLESFGNPRRFTPLARRVTRKKPVLTVKSGRTEAGARAASSHTGSIVGLDVAAESLLEQCGILRVSTLEEMFVKASALANQPVPAGNRLAVVTNAGGPAILCTDASIGRGLRMAELSKATRRALSKVLPAEASTTNPVDMIASAGAVQYRATLEHVMADPGVDGVIAIFVSPIMIDAFEVARAIAAAADGSKPLLSVFMGKERSREGLAELRSHGVPCYRFPDQAASGMAGLVRYGELRDAPQGKTVKFRVSKADARRVIAEARDAGRLGLTPAEVERLLVAYRFPVAPARTVRTHSETLEAARAVGYPVVLKIASDTISHKTDVGGVKVDLRNADEVSSAYRDIFRRLQRKDPELRVTVQKMVRGGREVILGMKWDKQFGPLLMFGLGGIHVEVMQDVAVRIHPLTDVDAKAMIERIKAYPLLAGTRGDKPVALELLRESLLRLSQLVADFEDDLAELDINPFIVTARAEDSWVVDARVTLRERS